MKIVIVILCMVVILMYRKIRDHTKTIRQYQKRMDSVDAVVAANIKLAMENQKLEMVNKMIRHDLATAHKEYVELQKSQNVFTILKLKPNKIPDLFSKN